MQLDDLFDYDTTTITPLEAATWSDLADAALRTASEGRRLIAEISPEDGLSLVIVLSAGLDALDEMGRIAK